MARLRKDQDSTANEQAITYPSSSADASPAVKQLSGKKSRDIKARGEAPPSITPRKMLASQKTDPIRSLSHPAKNIHFDQEEDDEEEVVLASVSSRRVKEAAIKSGKARTVEDTQQNKEAMEYQDLYNAAVRTSKQYKQKSPLDIEDLETVRSAPSRNNKPVVIEDDRVVRASTKNGQWSTPDIEDIEATAASKNGKRWPAVASVSNGNKNGGWSTNAFEDVEAYGDKSKRGDNGESVYALFDQYEEETRTKSQQESPWGLTPLTANPLWRSLADQSTFQPWTVQPPTRSETTTRAPVTMRRPMTPEVIDITGRPIPVVDLSRTGRGYPSVVPPPSSAQHPYTALLSSSSLQRPYKATVDMTSTPAIVGDDDEQESFLLALRLQQEEEARRRQELESDEAFARRLQRENEVERQERSRRDEQLAAALVREQQQQETLLELQELEDAAAAARLMQMDEEDRERQRIEQEQAGLMAALALEKEMQEEEERLRKEAEAAAERERVRKGQENLARAPAAELGGKQCPGCREIIIKNQGCHMMHCRCGKTFNYDAAPFVPFNFNSTSSLSPGSTSASSNTPSPSGSTVPKPRGGNPLFRPLRSFLSGGRRSSVPRSTAETKLPVAEEVNSEEEDHRNDRDNPSCGHAAQQTPRPAFLDALIQREQQQQTARTTTRNSESSFECSICTARVCEVFFPCCRGLACSECTLTWLKDNQTCVRW